MKSIETRAQFAGEGLTAQSNPSTLEVRGTIFMPEGSEEIPQQNPKGPPVYKDIVPESAMQSKERIETETFLGGRIEIKGPEDEALARSFWEKFYKQQGKILDELPAEDRSTVEMAIKEGILPRLSGGAPGIDLTGITDLEIRNWGNQFNRHLTSTGESSEVLRELWRDLAGKTIRPEQEGDKNLLLQKIDEVIVSRRTQEIQDAIDARNVALQERFGFYLQPADIVILKEDPVKWLDAQFDVLYKLAQEGQELTSPIINNLQTVASEAMRYVQYNNPDFMDEFQRMFTTRFHLIQMRAVIGYKGIEGIKQAAYSLQAHGLMRGMSLEEGRVGAMFNRLNELLEDERLKSENMHVFPETVNRLQDELIEEQDKLRDKGGIFAGKKREDIVRAVRTAFDIFVSSQRMAVIVARGKHLTGLDAYFADPASGPLNVYNLEDLLTGKFGIYNIYEEEILKEIKLDMARDSLVKKGINPNSVSEQDRIDLGRRLFRDIFAVPDFFSSGWRIEGVLYALEERLGEEVAKDLALFMRLKFAPENGREKIWEKIAIYRPEEVIRLFRERDNGRLNILYDRLGNIDNTLTPTADEKAREITVYDKFKDKYAAALKILREQGFQKDIPEQINMANLTQDQKELLNTALENQQAGDKVVEMFIQMQTYIKEQNLINSLVNDIKFEDIYTRTLLTDDALLDKLESDKWRTGDEERTVMPLSKRYGADQGGDAYVRIWNDTENAMRAGQNLVKFIKTENGEKRSEFAMEFADAASLYNGEEQRAKGIRYTIGTFLNLSKSDFIWDALGVGKLPFRKAMSKIEKIYGPQAYPMSRDELRRHLDQIHSILVFHADTEEKKIEAAHFYKDLEGLLEVTPKDAVKRRSVSLLFYLILAAIIEGYEVTGLKEVTGKK